jgi:DMSO/TMAO reductase YedYZ heme-binding membrane subunit
MSRIMISTRTLASATVAGLATFVTIVLALHVVQRGAYHPLSEAVSELALGRAGWLMVIAFCGLATGTLCAAALVRRTTASRAAPACLAIAAGLSYVSAVVHADAENARTTVHGEIHQAAGIVTFVLVIAAMLTCWRTFRRDPRWRPLTGLTLASAAAALVAFFLTPAVGAADFGVVQRVFLAVCLSWLALVALHGRRLAGEPAEERTSGTGATVRTAPF